jgi:hypothetical protein
MKNLTTGTKNMAGRPKKINLSAEDICKIIAECRSANVSEINFNGIHIVFQSQRNEIAPILGQGRDVVVSDDMNVTESKEAQLVAEQTLLDAEDAQILIEDPLAFEKLNTEMDLERNRVMEQ